jgi:peptide/nickel transport system substrate-binding protein
MTPQYGGVLHILAPSGQDNIGFPQQGAPPFNPFIPAPAIEGLLIRDNSGGPVPWLCESWDLDRDNLTLTLHLRKGVKFHDGTDFNAEAAKWNIDTLIASGQPELPHVASIEVLDDYTIRVNMSAWDILMVNYFILKAGNMVSPTAVQSNGADWAIGNPVGTGPFKFDSYQKDVKLKFTRNDDYWIEGKPYLDSVEWDYISDLMTRVAAFEAGEGQVITGLSAYQANELAQTGKYDVVTSPSQIFVLYPDSVHEDSPWSKLEVRQAACYAINNQAICDAFGYGYYQPTSQLAYPGYSAYDPTIQGYPFNPDKAKQLLAAAGYPNGFETTINYVSGALDDIYTAVQGYWEAVGIHATLNVIDSAKQIDIAAHGWQNGTEGFLPPFEPVGYPAAKNFTFTFSQGSIFAVSVIRPDDVEELINQALSAPTVEDMDKITQQINKLLVDKYCVSIPIFVLPNIAAKVTWLHDDRIDDTWQEQWNPQDAWLESGH